MDYSNFLFLSLLLVCTLLEAAWITLVQGKHYPWMDSISNFGVGIIKRIVDLLTYGAAAALLFWVYQYRIWTIEINSLMIGLVFFLLFEFAYYWHHRWAHEVRWMWATHSVHHSATTMNLSVSARLGATGLISGSILVFSPLALLGFHPLLIVFTLAASLFYQVFLHTELVKTLGPLEWLLNTPSHHRVHHASNRQYINKNYGGVLIVFDRMFGTFAKEEEAVKYGLTIPFESKNPIKIALFEWRRILRDCRKATSLSQMFGYMFFGPGWKPKQ
ncbi:MAG: sterol desaturase family protein [Psychrobium sp.]